MKRRLSVGCAHCHGVNYFIYPGRDLGLCCITGVCKNYKINIPLKLDQTHGQTRRVSQGGSAEFSVVLFFLQLIFVDFLDLQTAFRGAPRTSENMFKMFLRNGQSSGT